MTMRAAVALVALLAAALAVSSRAQVCGRHAGGALCGGCLCCSEFGYCGSTEIYCGDRCQSQCDGGSGGGVASIIPESLFEKLLKHRNDVQCIARGFYTYSAFITAAEAFPGFGTTGSLEVQKREIAAFLGQTGHEAAGGDPRPGGCIWFWMTPQGNKPSCHDVITEQWTPSPFDLAAGRFPGYAGVITNIINGDLECGHGYDEPVANRTFFYTSYCEFFGVSPGYNLDCYYQKPFANVFLPAGATTATLENRAEA